MNIGLKPLQFKGNRKSKVLNSNGNIVSQNQTQQSTNYNDMNNSDLNNQLNNNKNNIKNNLLQNGTPKDLTLTNDSRYPLKSPYSSQRSFVDRNIKNIEDMNIEFDFPNDSKYIKDQGINCQSNQRDSSKLNLHNNDSTKQISQLNSSQIQLQTNKKSSVLEAQKLLNEQSKLQMSQTNMTGGIYKQKNIQGEELWTKFFKQIKLSSKLNKFIIICKSVTNQNNLSDNQKLLIGDNSFVEKSMSNPSFLMYYFTQCINWYRNSRVLLPESNFVMGWEILVFVLIISQLIFIPTKVTFNLSYENGSINQLFFGFFAFFIFVIDIILMFNTGFYQLGILKTDRIEIGHHYLKSTFLLDAIASAGIFCVFLYEEELFDLTFILRALQIQPRLNKLNQYFQIKQKFQVAYDFTLLAILVLLMAHISGCGFHQVGVFDDFNGRHSWINEYEMVDKSFLEKYVASIYFAFVSMITVGYGDIHPVSTNERMYAILMTIVSCGVFGYCVNKMGDIFRQISLKKMKLERDQNLIQQFLKDRGIGMQTQYKVLRNLEFQAEQKLKADKEGIILINSIDQNLVYEFKRGYFGKVIQEQKIFSLNFTEETLDKCALLMEEVLFKSGEKIVFEKEKPIENLYMLMSGELQIYNENLEKIKILGQVEKRKFIGLNRFFSHMSPNNLSLICQTECRFICLKRVTFLEIIQKNTRDFQSFCDIRDSIQNKQKYLIQAEVCQNCLQQNHDINQCPELHPKLNEWVVIRKHQFSPLQERDSKFQRNLCKLLKNQSTQNTDDNNQNSIYRYNAVSQSQQVREDVRELRINIVYLLYGFSLKQEDEDIFDEDPSSKTDKHFFKVVPKIKKNKIEEMTEEKMKEVQKLLDKLDLMIENQNEENEEEDQQIVEIYVQIEDLQEQYSSSSEDDEYNLEISLQAGGNDDVYRQPTDQQLQAMQEPTNSKNNINQISEEDSQISDQSQDNIKQIKSKMENSRQKNVRRSTIQKKTEKLKTNTIEDDNKKKNVNLDKYGVPKDALEHLNEHTRFQNQQNQNQAQTGVPAKKLSTFKANKYMSQQSKMGMHNSHFRRPSTFGNYLKSSSNQFMHKKLGMQKEENVGYKDTSGLNQMEKIFDQIKEFQYYKPYNNFKIVIGKIVKKQIIQKPVILKPSKPKPGKKESQFNMSNFGISPSTKKINNQNIVESPNSALSSHKANGELKSIFGK